jgi:hypothetical protein
MNLLQIVQAFCDRTNLPSPATVIGSSDHLVRQIRAILEEIGTDMADRGAWQALTFEASFTTVAAESQGKIDSIVGAGNGFSYIKNETIWDRASRIPICGPLDAREWQEAKAHQPLGPAYHYRIRAGNLLIIPAPSAGLTWYFEYVSRNWITDSTGTVGRSKFEADTDLVRLPVHVLLMGLRWAWKKENGLEYAEDLRTYEAQLADAIGREGGRRRIKMDAPIYPGPRPGIFIPAGNWDL